MKIKKSKKRKKNCQSNRSDQSDKSVKTPKEMDKVECLEKVFDYLFRNYTLYSQSIDDYINKSKPSLRRRIIYHTITLNALMASILYLVLYLHPDRDEIKYLGAPMVTEFFVDVFTWFESVVNSVMLMYTVFCRMSVFHCESRFKSKYFDILIAMNDHQENSMLKMDWFDFNILIIARILDSPLINTIALTYCCSIPFNNNRPLSEMFVLHVNHAMLTLYTKTIMNSMLLSMVD